MANFMNKMKPAPIPKPAKMKKPIKKIEAVKEEVTETEETVEDVVSEVVETEEVVAEETTEIEEIIAEEDDKIEDIAMEEIIEDANKEEEQEIVEETTEEPVTEEVVVEEPKKKSKKRKSKKETTTEVSEDAPQTEEIVVVDIDRAEEILTDVITPVPSYWESEKEEIDGMLSSLVITEELDPTSIRTLAADMSNAYTVIQKRLQEAKTDYENLKDIIDSVKAKNSVGSSADERKLNAIKAVTCYKKDDESEAVDLLAYLRFCREKSEFYSAAFKTVDVNRQLLITFSAAYKIELGKAF